MDKIFETLGRIGIVPVVVIDNAEDAVPLAKALSEGGLPAAEITFRTSAAAEAIRRKGWNCILCPSPLNPHQPEALFLPEKHLAFAALAAPKPDSLPLLEQALQSLKNAKSLHDELELCYRPHMNFTALNQYTEDLIASLFPV